MAQYSMDQKRAVHKIIKRNASNLFSNTPHGFTNCIQGRTVVVGNGELPKGSAKFIDSFDTVIRCNSWRNYGSEYQTGSKVTVIFLNGRSMKHVEDNAETDCLNVVVEQTKTENNARAVREVDAPTCTLSDNVWKQLKPYYDKVTTGFMAVCIAMQKTRSVTIVGMEGKGSNVYSRDQRLAITKLVIKLVTSG
jgi:hypothetical protein